MNFNPTTSHNSMETGEKNLLLRKKRIGIMGGTFDPIHFGHLIAAEEAYCVLNLSEVVFVPTGNPPHKTRRQVSFPEDRYIMTLMATIDNPHFKISRIEIDREGPSHTIDTLREMRHWHPPGSVQFYFITGLDAVLELPSWKDPYNIIKETSIVAVTRPGYSVERLDELPEAIKKAVVLLEIPMLAISSTAIRRRVAEGSSIRYLVPWNVEHYIYKKGLYIRDGR